MLLFINIGDAGARPRRHAASLLGGRRRDRADQPGGERLQQGALPRTAGQSGAQQRRSGVPASGK